MIAQEGEIAAISVSIERGESKKNVAEATLLATHGIDGDAHAGDWHRQVSLLAFESIELMRERGADVSPGDFGENITSRGVELSALQPGDRIYINDVELEITQVGKDCREPCSIYDQIGDCVMPRDGVFARVLRGGKISVGDTIRIKS
jgi:MOSC domain-containing protein YiiM